MEGNARVQFESVGLPVFTDMPGGGDFRDELVFFAVVGNQPVEYIFCYGGGGYINFA